MTQQHPLVQVTASPGAPELQLLQLRQRKLDALVIDARRMQPAPDLRIEHLPEMAAGFIVRADHPLTGQDTPPTFADIRRFPLASTPLGTEIARMLVQRFGPAADPEQAVQLRSEDITGLLEVVKASDAVFLGIFAAARSGIAAGTLAPIDLQPPLSPGAHYAFVTLEGRTEAPSLQRLRQFVKQHLRD